MAGTVTHTVVEESPGDLVLSFAFTADDSDGSVPATTVALPYPVLVTAGIVNPGSTAPTDNYDIAVNDADGVDIFGGELNNRDTTNSEQATPKVGNAYGPRRVDGSLTLVVTNNAVNSATGVVRLHMVRV